MRATARLAVLAIVVPSILAIASISVAIPLDWYDYIDHTTIDIDSNDEFVSASGVLGGSGSRDNPYLISTWGILPPSSMDVPTAIRIANTTAYVLIEYVHVQHARFGILLQNATNVTVRSCLITHNEFGVSFEHCSSCEITNSSLGFNERAIRILDSTNVEIWNNGYQDNSAVIVYSEPATISWWAIALASLLGAVLVVLLVVMQKDYTARKSPVYRISARAIAVGFVLILDFYQVGQYLERSFVNGAMSWNYYVMLTGIAVLFGLMSVIFALIYKAKWIESKLP